MRRHMTKTGCGLAAIMLWTVLVGTAVPRALAAAPEAAGVAVETRGEVRAVFEKRSRKLEAPAPVHRGDLLLTGKDGSALVEFFDGAALRLGPGAEIAVDEFVYERGFAPGRLVMRAVKGLFRFVTGLVAAEDPGAFKVETPLGTIGVRGTEFEALVAPDAVSVRLAGGGPLFFTDLMGNLREISRIGDGVRVAPGQPVPPPAPMPVLSAAPSASGVVPGRGEAGARADEAMTASAADRPSETALTSQIQASLAADQARETLAAVADLQQSVPAATGDYLVHAAHAYFNVDPADYVQFGSTGHATLNGQVLDHIQAGAEYYGLVFTGDTQSYLTDGFNYAAWGYWENTGNTLDYAAIQGAPVSTIEKYPSWSESDSIFVAGPLTPAADIPRTGTASYSGLINGKYFDEASGSAAAASGDMSMSFNFGTDAVTAAAFNIYVNGGLWDSASLTEGAIKRTGMAFPYFNGSLASTAGAVGAFQGNFFGPAANEIGGVFLLNKLQEHVTGIFRAK